MKKLLATALVLTGCVGFFSIADAFATKDQGYVSITASETREIDPNVVMINFSVETTDKTLEKASEENKKIADDVYMALRGLIDVENGDYVKTQNFSANPVYSYKNNKQILDGYKVVNELSVKSNSIDLASKLIDTGLKKGANRVSDLQFEVGNYETQCAEMLGAATKKAQVQAGIVSKNINKKIAGVKSISTNCSAPRNYPMAYRTMSKSVMDSASGAATPIEGGKTKIQATVDAQFYVK